MYLLWVELAPHLGSGEGGWGHRQIVLLQAFTWVEAIGSYPGLQNQLVGWKNIGTTPMHTNS